MVDRTPTLAAILACVLQQSAPAKQARVSSKSPERAHNRTDEALPGWMAALKNIHAIDEDYNGIGLEDIFVSAPMIAKVAGISNDTARRHLKHFVKQDVLQHHGSGTRDLYHISPRLGAYEDEEFRTEEQIIEVAKRTLEVASDENSAHSTLPSSRNEADLFIAPASAQSGRPYEHLKRTVLTGVDEKLFAQYSSFGADGPCRLWGVTSGRSGLWDDMQPGDWLIFYTGSDGMEYAAEVIGTEHNPDFAHSLWDDYLYPTGTDHPMEPWNRLIHLSEPIELELTATKFRGLLDYDSNYVFPGFSRPAADRLSRLRTKYGSIEEFVRSFQRA